MATPKRIQTSKEVQAAKIRELKHKLTVLGEENDGLMSECKARRAKEKKLTEENERLKNEMKAIETEWKQWSRPLLHRMQSEEENGELLMLQHFTGLTSLEVADAIAAFIDSQREKRKRIFTTREEVLMTLSRLKLGLPFRTMMYLYKKPGSRCHSSIINFVDDLRPLIAKYYKAVSVRLPPRQEMPLHRPPKVANKFERATLLLDCTYLYLTKQRELLPQLCPVQRA